MLRSAGYEPYSEGLDERKLNLLLCRLIPLVEANFNMVELGPRSSGKSYIYKEITPYAILISGGQGSVAQLFVNNTSGRVGAVGLWDAICFDESTDKLFKDSDYNAKMLNELVTDEITEFYFLSFADENPDSEQIEYVGEMLKKDVLSFFKIAE